jgi:hypothetical protein
MRKYKVLEVAVHAAPDRQISLTDPDARSMATTGKDTGLVGYNVQAVVEAQHHLIVAHEVTNFGNDRSQLSTMAEQAQEATGVRALVARTKPSSTRCRSGWTARPRPCASDARPRNIHSEPSRHGWARPTSGCAPSNRSARR